jgi:hypothetical protein
MDYRVVLVESEEGFAASCPVLRGCHSQGATREEALNNISVSPESRRQQGQPIGEMTGTPASRMQQAAPWESGE